MKRVYCSGLEKSLMNKTEYKQIEISVNGKKVHALFPNVDEDSKNMALVQEILISSYMDHINKNVSLVEKSNLTNSLAGQSSAA